MLRNSNQIVKIDKLASNLEDEEITEASKNYIDQLTLKISKIEDINESELQKLFAIFNKYKFVILETEALPNIQDNLLALKKIFGSIIRHKRSDENGIVSVENLGSFPIDKAQLLSATNQMFSMHTDGTYEIEPPKVVAMQCVIPSNHGGCSQIVYAESVYDYLMENHPQELQSLFSNPLNITRGNQTATRAIFAEIEGRISMTFRADPVVSIIIPPPIEKVFNVIKNYINTSSNQLIFKLKANQILVLDNTSVLHGRTSFPDNEVRKVNRLCFDGISEYSQNLKFGFIPKSKVSNS
ncbi:TauD/TfdA family dioxygenase [Pelatocladus sp. BLCC-F211]|uniref:TauD/TfdA family dioxygenase n=1 Tax=Pelatocladus sp. BLCC-F211 TaxID=3342752 RepID=UPI0035B6BEE0